MNGALRVLRVGLCAGLGLPLLLLAGCGMVGAPQPPSLKLPQPVTDLTAHRTGDRVVLRWTMPKRTTDKVLLVGDQRVQVCRHVDADPCVPAGSGAFAPEAAAEFTDSLPSSLASGTLRSLTYTVELLNHAGRSAGPSNVAITAAGAAPPRIENLHAQVVADGVELRWTPQGSEETVRIQRMLIQKTGTEAPVALKSEQRSQPPVEQTLEFSGHDQGGILDHDAALDHVYTYSVQRVAKLASQGEQIEVTSEPSATVSIDARDVFPPSIPVGLEAVADPESHAIDLSWQPDTEADLAGYAVYRSEAGASPVRISGPVQAVPSFRDTGVMPGHSYAYSVSAIDRDGNESQRSAAVEEALPQP
jgi:hypothetical protein